MFISQERLQNIEAIMKNNTERIWSLEEYARECSSLHQKAAEHWARQDESLRELTTSNTKLANSLDSLNSTVIDILTNDRPQSEFVKGWRITAYNNKLIFAGIIAVVSLILTVAQLSKVL